MCGPPSSGKTTLLYQFIERHSDAFERIYIVDHKNPQAIRASYRNVVDEYDLPISTYATNEVLIKKVHRELSQMRSNRPFLLAIDNAPSDQIEDLPTQGGTIIILTTQTSQNDLPLIQFLKEDQAIELLRKRTQIRGKLQEMGMLSEELDYHPHALQLAANLIHVTQGMGIQTYLDLLPAQLKDDRPSRPVERVLTVNLNHLATTSEQGYALLTFFAHLAPEAIPINWITSWFSEEAPQHSPKRTDALLSMLSDQGLVIYRPTESILIIPPTTRTAVHDKTGKFDRNPLIEFMIKQIERFDREKPYTWLYADQWVEHVNHMLDSELLGEMSDAQKAVLYFSLGDIHLVKGTYDQALEAFSHIQGQVDASKYHLALSHFYLDNIDIALAVDEELHSDAQCLKADCYVVKRKYQEAEQLYKRIYDEYIKDNYQQPVFLRATLGLAQLYCMWGRDGDSAKRDEYLKIPHQQHAFYAGINHPDIVRFYFLYSTSMVEQDRFDEAKNAAHRALAICEALYPNSRHLNVALANDNLATILATEKRAEEALVYSQRACEIMEVLFPNRFHSTKGLLYETRATILISLNRTQEAILQMSAILLALSAAKSTAIDEAIQLYETLKGEGDEKAVEARLVQCEFYRQYDPNSLYTTYFQTALWALQHGYCQMALSLLDLALSNCGADTPNYSQAQAYKGLAHEKIGNTQEACTLLFQAIDHYRSQNRWIRPISEPLLNQVKRCIETDDYLTALILNKDLYRLILKWLDLSEENRIPKHLLSLLETAALECFRTGNHSLAEHYWQATVDYCTVNYNESLNHAAALYKLGRCQSEQGRWSGKKDLSVSNLEYAQDIYMRIIRISEQNTIDHAEALIARAKVLYHLWRYSNSADCQEKAVSILTTLQENSAEGDGPAITHLLAKLQTQIEENHSLLKRATDYSRPDDE